MINKITYLLPFIFLAACGNTDVSNTTPKSTTTTNEPQQLTYTITNQYPHDTTTYTEGLEFYNHTLYESGGQYGISKLVAVDLNTGKDIKKIPLDKKYFGEGITIINNKIYQMTWKEKTCFVYDAKTFAKIKEFTYDGEGWGMTNNCKQIIMSDGSNNLYFRDPETFKVLTCFQSNTWRRQIFFCQVSIISTCCSSVEGISINVLVAISGNNTCCCTCSSCTYKLAAQI